MVFSQRRLVNKLLRPVRRRYSSPARQLLRLPLLNWFIKILGCLLRSRTTPKSYVLLWDDLRVCCHGIADHSVDQWIDFLDDGYLNVLRCCQHRYDIEPVELDIGKFVFH